MEIDPRTLSVGVRGRSDVRTSTLPARLRALERFDTPVVWWLALGALLVIGAVFLYAETRGTTFWFDEWIWALTRRGSSLGSFLDAHNGHLSLVPVAIYKLLFATAGLRHYAPYRIVVIAAHLSCVTLIFAYAIRRVEGYLALLAAALLLFFGMGWQNFLWPFQVAWLISLGSGVAALLALDRGDGAGRAVACGLTAISLASSGLGVAVALGLLIDVLFGRRGWRALWVVGGPLVLYALWSLGYQDSAIARHGLVLAPGWAANAAASTLSAMLGVGGTVNPAVRDYPGTLLEWGPPLAVAGSVVLVWRLLVLRRSPTRVFALLTSVVSFWLLTGLTRWDIGAPWDSRYLYAGALFLLLIAIELAAGARVSWQARIVIGIVALAGLISNVGDVRTAGDFLRTQAELTRAQVGSLDIARQIVRPGFGTGPFGIIYAGLYLATERAIGSPAATPAQIAASGEPAREAADQNLAAIDGLRLGPAAAPAQPGPAPTLDGVSSGTPRSGGSCVKFSPSAVPPAGATPTLSVTVPPSGLVVRTGGQPAAVSYRRFGSNFQQTGTVGPNGRAQVRIRADLATEPWHLQVGSSAPLSICGLAP